jgi:hypothetical protein
MSWRWSANELAKQLCFARFLGAQGFLAIDTALHIYRPFLRILTPEERLVEVLPLATDLGSPRAGF